VLISTVYSLGLQYAWIHYQITRSLSQALYDSGIYVERSVLLSKCAVLPKLDINIDESLQRGIIKIENCIKYDRRLDELPIGSALPNEYVLTSCYISDDSNDYIYEFEVFKLEQLVFNSYSEFSERVKKTDQYDLFLNDRHILPMFHILLIGQTGSGKSYALYNIILQMLTKENPWELYIADPKYSGTYVIGNTICKDRVASSTSDIVNLLSSFQVRMEQRKLEMNDNLLLRLDSDYRDFNLLPICLIIDEYSAFRASLTRYDKKTRDFVDEVLGNVVREGRQLGCFLIIAQQQTNSTNLPTELKENIPCKIILGMAERQTYITALGIYPDVAKRHFCVGQGLLVYPGIATPELPSVTTIPTLNFDILDTVKRICEDRAGVM